MSEKVPSLEISRAHFGVQKVDPLPMETIANGPKKGGHKMDPILGPFLGPPDPCF